MGVFHVLLAAVLLTLAASVPTAPTTNVVVAEPNKDPNQVDSEPNANVATEFWEQIYQNSMLNTKSRYSVLNDERVCFTCPIDRSTFTSLYHEALDQSSSHALGSMHSLPPLTITWAAQLNENRVIFFCRNNTRLTPSPVYLSGNVMVEQQQSSASHAAQLDYSCESNRLCLNTVKNSYPKAYQCFVKSYVLNVRLDVIVQLQYVLLYFTGDSVKFDYQKEVTVQEGQPFTIKCEVPETNPVSIVSAYIDNQELALTALDKKTLDNRMTINTYSFQVNATRNMNMKKVKCEAMMRDLPADLANTIDLRSHLSKDYTLSVHYLPTCTYPSRIYRAGINRSLLIECPINSSNPDVTYYKIIPPSSRTKFELIDSSLDTLSRVGRFRIQPSSQADFGLYECIPRSLAGTAKCDIFVELGATPNPPEQCSVQFARVNNKTFAQFSCKPGHNQGGLTSFLTIYEVVDKQLKLSGRVNIDESKMDKEVPYITPADEDKYYEFLVMQENNYGNSTSVLLRLGSLPEPKSSPFFDSKNIYWIAGAVAVLLFFICVCSCCCCTDSFSGAKHESGFCARCCSSESMDDDGLTYKKAPMDADALSSPVTGGSGSGGYAGYTPVDALHTNSLLKMSYHHPHGNYNSNYEYYDNTNTSANLLSSSGGGGHYGKPKSRATTKKPPSQSPNAYDPYNYEPQREDDYEDGSAEKAVAALARDDDEDDEDNYEEEMESISSSRSEKNTNSTSGNEESSGRASAHEPTTPTYVPKQSGVTSAVALFNNNVSGSIGSGVESMKKHTYGLTTNHGAGKMAKPPSNGTYSTIDKKKLIKTDNGLVYTPINDEMGCNGDASSPSNEPDDVVASGGVFDYDNFEPIGTAARRLPNGFVSTKKPNQFQTELSQKLKSINGSQSSAGSVVVNPSKLVPPAANNEHMSNSTATTSISSASSCASNADLIVHNRKPTESYLGNGAKPSQLNLTRTTVNELSINGNKNYSLLKTTINVAAAAAAASNSNGSLGRTGKPPILKPKPRSNGSGIYQQVNGGKGVYDSSSVHNQSGEPLLNSHPETTTSPSTSITDISSTNCTPQHAGQDDNGVVLGVRRNNIVSRPTNLSSNSLSRPPVAKVTTTFGPNNGLYSTVKTGSETMRTFGEAGTLGRRQAAQGSPLRKIDENNYEAVTRPVAGAAALTRTMERRHVKNSEI